MPDPEESPDGRRGGLVQRSLRGDHGVQQGQAENHSGAPNERAPRDKFLFDKVHLVSFATIAPLGPLPERAAASSISLVRIWKGALLIMPIRIDVNRSLLRSASRTIDRITGRSSYSTPRPKANVINFSVIIRTNCGE